MFDEKFNKFKESIKKYNLIDNSIKKIIIAMSGGKDCAVLASFLLEYQKKERPDLELEMWTVSIPHWEQKPEKLLDTPISPEHREILLRQKDSIKIFHDYWSQYMDCKTVPVEEELYQDRVLKMNWGCMLCFSTKMKGFNKYFLEHPYDNNTLIAFGWTKWDSHYTLLSHLLKSNGSKWYDVKKNNYNKYKNDCIFLASFAAYPRTNIGIPNKEIYKINPLLDFDDIETTELVKELQLPLIKDICKEMFGNRFNQDRRFIADYLELCSINQNRLNLSHDSLLFDYNSLLNFFINSEIIPPAEEIDNLLYDAYDSDFDDLYNLLKHK